MRTVLSWLTVMLFSVTTASAVPVLSDEAAWPVRSQGHLRFSADKACFRGHEGKTLLELYTLIDARQLQFIPEGERHVAQIDVSLILQDSLGTVKKQEFWTRNPSVSGPERLAKEVVLYRDVIGIDVEPGTYKATLIIEDIYGDVKGTVEVPVEVADISDDVLETSDVLLAALLDKSTRIGKFTKFGYRVVPNTSRTQLAGDPMRIYFELYNLSEGTTERGKSLVVGYTLKDTSDQVVRTYPATRIQKPGVSAVKTSTLVTDGLAPGNYTLEVEAFDPENRQHVRTRRRIVLVSEESPAPASLTEEEQTQLAYYRDIRVVGTDQDLQVYESLGSDESKMKFLKAFWAKHDPTPGTPLNERLVEHIRRLRHADNAFSGQAQEAGRDTDMGRVYAQYGPPDDVDRQVLMTSDVRPYEVWHYGRHEFVFQDRNSLGIFELVHSDYPGEASNPFWNQ